jgi:hypothetical protein
METKGADSLPAHYEKCLGPITRGWSDDKEGHGIQVVSFREQPQAGIATFATLGLSRYSLKQKQDGKKIRQELLVSSSDVLPPDAVAAFLLSVAEHALRQERALLRGEVIGPHSPVIPSSTLTAVFVTNPSPLNRALIDFASDPPPTVFAYLIPITANEASLVQEKGWQWFEEELEEQDPDIWDLNRIEEVRER